jgi:23S rRNA (uracil1939-C5)-methyltransferase
VRTKVEIDALAPGGEGVGRSGGRRVFVPFTAPGDRIAADVPTGAGPAHGVLLEVLAQGADRVAPPCRHFGVGALGPATSTGPRTPPSPPLAPGQPHPAAPALALARECGGCEWLHVRYEAQLAAKARGFAETLRRIGRLDPEACGLRPILASPAPLRYRARAKFHLDRASGRLAFFRRRSHAAVPLEECHLLAPGLDALRAAVGPALVAARLAPTEVALEWSDLDGKGSALLLLEPTPAARARAEELLAAVPSLSGLLLRGEAGAAIRVGDPVLRLARVPGRPDAGTQRSRPDVFQQANRAGNALLVEAALGLLRPEGEDVLELHCGSGNFTAPLAARARSVAAVEVQGPALDLAREDLGGASNVRFFAGDALKLALALARERGPSARRFGAVLLDPPREGAKGIGPALRELGAPRAVYVSCDPATLARDVRGCVQAGYRVAAVQPVDMFPQTHHVEGVVLLVAER